MISSFVAPFPLRRTVPLSRAAHQHVRSLRQRCLTTATAGPGGSDRGKGSDDRANIEVYNDWISGRDPAVGADPIVSQRSAISSAPAPATPRPPPFGPRVLFHAGAEEYATALSTPPTPDYVAVGRRTAAAGMFAPCLVGPLEGQFLKMIAQIKGARRVLDIGTFTGYSALAFADGLAPDDEAAVVVTVEADPPTAAIARESFAEARNGHRIRLIEDDADAAMRRLRDEGEKFDIIFLDADKVNYQKYYEIGLDMLEKDGILMADNALCSILFDDGDPAIQPLHDFAQHVREDPRVEQVMLTVREGVLVVRKV